MFAQGYLSLGVLPAQGYKWNMTNMLEIPLNTSAKIVQIHGKARLKLRQHGLHVGDVIRILREAPLGGPLLVDVNSREVAIGRKIAEKIIVEVE